MITIGAGSFDGLVGDYLNRLRYPIMATLYIREIHPVFLLVYCALLQFKPSCRLPTALNTLPWIPCHQSVIDLYEANI